MLNLSNYRSSDYLLCFNFHKFEWVNFVIIYSMNFFDKNKEIDKIELSEAEATFCIFLSIIYADGKMTDEEIDEFSFYFRKIKLFKKMTITDLFPVFQKLFKQCEYNPETVVELVCPFISVDNRLPVFIYCCDFVYSDLLQKPNEERLLQKVMYGLTLDEALAENITHIMRRKSQL